MLGLFKENATPAEAKRGSQAVRPPPAANLEHFSEEDRAPGLGISKVQTETARREDPAVPTNATQQALNTERSNIDAFDGAQNHGDGASYSLRNVSKSATETRLQPAVEKNARPNQLPSRKRMPSRLLEEIRQHHNLHTPFHDKFRQSQVRPVQKTTAQEQVRAETTSPELGVDEAKFESTPEAAAAEQAEEEEDESDREHISSALYYPHQAPSPDALQDVNIGDARTEKEKK